MWQARAGQMGTAQLPIMVALATKNNVIECKTFILVDFVSAENYRAQSSRV